MKRQCFLLLAGCTILLYSGSVKSPDRDTRAGAELKKVPPQRIVSLAPSLTESVFLLGAGDRLKGCTTYCLRPEQAKHREKVGTLIDVNLERIVTLQPDLVLAMEFSDRRSVEKLTMLGVRVEIFPSPKNFAHLCSSFLRLGRLIGCADQAGQIVDQARLEVMGIRRRLTGTEPIKIFWQLGARPLIAATDDYFTHDYIAFSGGINVAAGADRGIFSREEVLKQNPDVIVIVTMGIAGEEEKRIWEMYPHMNAVKNRRIYIVDSYTYCSPTPAGFVTALRELLRLLRPGLSLTGER